MNKNSSRTNIKKKLKLLYTLEFLNIILVPMAFFIFGYPNILTIGINSIFAIVLTGVLFLEGGFFWLTLYRAFENKHRTNSIKVFQALKKINIVLFAFVGLCILVNPFSGVADRISTFFFYSLAVLEHIHYFEFQLMYTSLSDLQFVSNHRQLKKSKIKKWISYSIRNTK